MYRMERDWERLKSETFIGVSGGSLRGNLDRIHRNEGNVQGLFVILVNS